MTGEQWVSTLFVRPPHGSSSLRGGSIERATGGLKVPNQKPREGIGTFPFQLGSFQIHGHFFQREPRVFMSWCLSWSWVYHFFITGRHWFVKMYEKTVAFKRFLNIKVTSLLKYKEKTLQCSDKRCRAMNHQYSRVAWQFWMRARQELQQKVMPRCTLNYYIIIIDFRDMGRGFFP